VKKIEAQTNGLILKFLNKVYPDGLTLKLIEGLLYDWKIFTTERELLKENVRYLLNKDYIEVKDVDFPSLSSSIKKVYLTAKGKALLEGEFIDHNVELEI